MNLKEHLSACLSVSFVIFICLGCTQKFSTAAAQVVQPKIRNSPDDAPKSDEKNTLAIDYMMRGYCTAKSSSVDKTALGGFGRSNRAPQEITSTAANASNECYLLAQPKVVTDFANGKGMRLVLVNASSAPVTFSACDSRLNIIQEAKDESGMWKPIEYLPSSWCGNSYHRVSLDSGQFWSFPVPRYTGSLKTLLRFRLIDGADKTLLVSNEFKGSVNLKQFTAKQTYNPKSLMDPYDPVSPTEDDSNRPPPPTTPKQALGTTTVTPNRL